MGKSKIAINSLVALLTTFFVCGKNATYKAKDFAYRLIQSALENQSLEAMSKLTGYLSADRVLDKIHEITNEKINKLIEKVNRNLKLPKKVILAIDFHDREYYGDKNHSWIIGSKGGKYVRRVIELSIVKLALFINAFLVNQLTNNKVKLIKQLIDGFYKLFDSKIELLLVDRAFFTKAVVNYLIENKIKFIMPAVKNKAILPLAEQFRKGWLPNKIEYQFGKQKIALLFLKVNGKVLVYATNTRYRPLKAHLLYRKRWQIETNFREQNNFLFKTQTIDFTVGYFAFVLAGLLFNLWQLTRNGKIESYLFKHELLFGLIELWEEWKGESIVNNTCYLPVT